MEGKSTFDIKDFKYLNMILLKREYYLENSFRNFNPFMILRKIFISFITFLEISFISALI
jgi:hypothetical protein